MRRDIAAALGVALLLVGVGRPLRSQGAAGSLAPPAAPAAIARLLDPDTTFFAEGLDIDPRDGTLWVTSLRHRNVFRWDAQGGRHALLRDAAGVGAVFGIAIDTARDLAWVTAAALPHMRPAPGDSAVRAELLRVRLSDGRVTGRWTLGDGRGAPGELALAPDGTVLVSDALQGVLYRLRAGRARGAADGLPIEVVRSPLLRSPQGIAVDAPRGVAYVADWSRGLMRWDLVTDSVDALPGAEGQPVRGIDGLRLRGDELLAVQNGARTPRVLALTLAPGHERLTAARIVDVAPPGQGEPTVGAIHGDRYIYVSSSAWPFWTEAGVRREGSGALPAVTVREVRIAP